MYEILIAEDDESIRTNISFLLRKNSYETITAENGKTALELAKIKHPDLIVSDINMPELNGFQFREELLKDPVTESIPFIFLSVKSDYEDVRKGMTIGADDYLAKPFRASDLLDAIKIRLYKKQKEQKILREVDFEIVKNLQFELRTPLVSILGFSQLIMQKKHSLTVEEISDMIEKINSSGNKMLDLIEKYFSFSDLVLLSRNSALLRQLKSQYILNIKKNIHEQAFRMAIMYNRQFDIVLNLNEAAVCISEMHFKKMFNELLQNAFEYSITGTEVIISAEAKEKSYVIEITNQGIGMTQEQVNELLNSKECKRNNPGGKRCGLGMVLINKIIDLYKGELNITSKPGKFTRVSVSLRIKKITD